MNIRNLSILTGINQETIRSYRIKGLINPMQEKNGYYNYSIEDYITLIHLRKLRGFSMGLDTIERYYRTENDDEVISLIEDEQAVLRRQMIQMEMELRYLEFEKQHITQSDAGKQTVTLIDAIDEKVDFYNLTDAAESNYISSNFPDIYSYSSPTLRIPKEILNGECTDRMIDIQAGIGTYRHVMLENNIPEPSYTYVVIPKTECLCQIVTLSDLKQMNLITLKPLMNYAREHGYEFVSDTTGFLLRVHLGEQKTMFRFRVRAAVRKR